MNDNESPDDYYEVLQISPNAEPETIHRVFRILAQRYHPDNTESGNESRFRTIHHAYQVLSDPATRAKFDATRLQTHASRWRQVAEDVDAATDFELEEHIRLTSLEVLYSRRRTEPNKPGLLVLDLEELLGRPREHLEFTMWFLIQKSFVQRTDDSRLAITATGVEYLEKNYRGGAQRRRLHASGTAA